MATWGADARYTRLVDKHGGALLHLAILVTGNRHDAEDVVQDVLISVAKNWSAATPTAGFAYLKKAVANRAVDIHRQRREVPTDELPEGASDDYGFLAHEEKQRFFALLASLPERQRATLVLRFHADMDDRTIAQTLGVSIATVRSQAQHGLAKLRADQQILDERISS